VVFGGLIARKIVLGPQLFRRHVFASGGGSLSPYTFINSLAVSGVPRSSACIISA